MKKVLFLSLLFTPCLFLSLEGSKAQEVADTLTLPETMIPTLSSLPALPQTLSTLSALNAPCEDLTKDIPADVKEQYLQSGQIQELIWELSLAGDTQAADQFKAQLQEKLSQGEVVSMKPLNMGGLHSSFKVALSSGVEGVFKPYNPWDASMNYKSEIAAYLVDQLLGLNLVPMTIKRKINGEVGSLQLFIRDATVARDLPEKEREKTKLLQFFDYLIRGTDRNPGNYLFKNQRLVAIDHGWSFRPWDIYHQPPFSKMWSLDKGRVFQFMPDEKTFNNLVQLEDKTIRKTLKPYLSSLQINDLIKRKNHFIYKVQKWIKKIGKEKVFSPSPLP